MGVKLLGMIHYGWLVWISKVFRPDDALKVQAATPNNDSTRDSINDLRKKQAPKASTKLLAMNGGLTRWNQRSMH